MAEGSVCAQVSRAGCRRLRHETYCDGRVIPAVAALLLLLAPRGNLLSLLPRFGQADRDGLSAAFHLAALAAGPALQRSLFAPMHGAFDSFRCALRILRHLYLLLPLQRGEKRNGEARAAVPISVPRRAGNLRPARRRREACMAPPVAAHSTGFPCPPAHCARPQRKPGGTT